MTINKNKLIKEAKVIEEILSPLTSQKISKAFAQSDISENAVLSAIQEFYLDIASSKNEDALNTLVSVFDRGGFFDQTRSLTLFKKIANLFGLDVEKACSDASKKVVDIMRSNGGKAPGENEIQNIVSSSVSRFSPPDMSRSEFDSIVKRFSQENTTKSIIRMAKIFLALGTDDMTESFGRWVTSERMVIGIANKIIFWIINYLVSAVPSR
jgi:hypothetical protein